MALLVGVPVEVEGLAAIGLVGHDRIGAALVEPLPEPGAVVGGIAEQPGGRPGAPQQPLGRRAIVGLTARQEDGKKTASSIRQCVDLRIAPAS